MHGTNGGWLRHKAQGEAPCASCEQAHGKVTDFLARFRVPAESQIRAGVLAEIFGVTEGTVRSWASRDHWRRTPAHLRPVYYSTHDALASYERLVS